METLITLFEVAERTGKSYDLLKKACQRGVYPSAIKVPIKPGAKKTTWAIPTERLSEVTSGKPDTDYETHFKGFLRRIELDGAAPEYVDVTEDYLDRFWRTLGKAPSLRYISANGLQMIVDHYGSIASKHRDYYSTKMGYYKAISSFAAYLVDNGHLRESEIVAIRAVKIEKKVKPHRGVNSLEDVEALLNANRGWKMGKVPSRAKRLHVQRLRSEFDIALMQALICLYTYAGLRRFEAGEILMKDYNPSEGHFVVMGKHRKARVCALYPEVVNAITEWISHRDPQSEYLLHNEDGDKLTARAIASRCARFYEATELRVRSHDLRTTFATVAGERGMPVPLIQYQLGHAKISTTQGYMQIAERSMIDWVARHQALFTATEAPVKQYIQTPRKTADLIKPDWMQ